MPFIPLISWLALLYRYPYSVAISNDGRIFVTNQYPSGVYVFSMQGALLGTLIYPTQGLQITGLAFYAPLNRLYAADNYLDQIISFSAAPAPTVNGSLCALLYSLPGNIDYPWSDARSFSPPPPTRIPALRSSLSLSAPIPRVLLQVRGRVAAVLLHPDSHHQQARHRRGVAEWLWHSHVHQPLRCLHHGPHHAGHLQREEPPVRDTSHTTPPHTLRSITLGSTHQLSLVACRYLNSTLPVDQSGIFYGLANGWTQLPGIGPTDTYSTLLLYNASGYLAEQGDQRIDNLGSAFLATVPSFRNLTIGASNVNALAANYATCKAPITFSNGLRSPTQPSASNGAARFRFTYNISDGATYTVFTNLTLTAASGFATTQDLLGNPYQQLTNATGTRLYTYLPTGQQLLSTVNGLYFEDYVFAGDQRWYPYTLLASAPGVYTTNTAPFLDYDGITYRISPSAPVLGDPINANTSVQSYINVFQATTLVTSFLLEDYIDTVPVPALQQQTFTLL